MNTHHITQFGIACHRTDIPTDTVVFHKKHASREQRQTNHNRDNLNIGDIGSEKFICKKTEHIPSSEAISVFHFHIFQNIYQYHTK